MRERYARASESERQRNDVQKGRSRRERRRRNASSSLLSTTSICLVATLSPSLQQFIVTRGNTLASEREGFTQTSPEWGFILSASSFGKNDRIDAVDGMAIERFSIGVSERKWSFGGICCFQVFRDFEFSFELLDPLFPA